MTIMIMIIVIVALLLLLLLPSSSSSILVTCRINTCTILFQPSSSNYRHYYHQIFILYLSSMIYVTLSSNSDLISNDKYSIKFFRKSLSDIVAYQEIYIRYDYNSCTSLDLLVKLLRVLVTATATATTAVITIIA